MKSRAIVKKERFTSIVNSKRLSEILTAYFDVSSSTSLEDLVDSHEDMFKFWAHEFGYDYDDLIKICDFYYDEPVKFEITDRKFMTGYDESYGSWIALGKGYFGGLFITWDLV